MKPVKMRYIDDVTENISKYIVKLKSKIQICIMQSHIYTQEKNKKKKKEN